tara:strand:- start:69 stop:182 length:114 start_codon:yes stop_codon:yes gene_type:complete
MLKGTGFTFENLAVFEKLPKIQTEDVDNEEDSSIKYK